MRVSKLVFPMRAVILLLSGCSNNSSEKQSQIESAAIARLAQVDGAILEGCKAINATKYADSVASFGKAARLNPAYLAVASAAEIYAAVGHLLSSTTDKEVALQMATDYTLLLGFCNGAQ